ncbi:MAG: TRAP transporter large permease [Oscillospiraceae bacterium]|nr:TRAP transporter large permease [Oscillospiraceae bacterium]
MTPVDVGIIGVIALIVLLFLRVPVGFAMVIVSVVGTVVLTGNITSTLSSLGLNIFLITQNFNLSVVPLFVLMGCFLGKANLGGDLLAVMNALVGRYKGGLAMATIGAAAVFSAVCGSVVAAVSTISNVSVPEMKKYKYDEGFAAGTASVSSAAGVVIPPSTALVVYGAVTEESIGAVLIAGILPGIVLMIMLTLTVPVVMKFMPHLAPEPSKEKIPFPWEKLKIVWVVPAIFLISMGGIYMGFFTPTEAGSVGAFLSLIFALCTRRMSKDAFLDSIKVTVKITGMVFFLLIGGKIFGSFLARSLLPLHLSRWIAGLEISPFLIIMVVLFIYTFLGLFMDEMATLVIMTPIIYPVVIAMGYSGIWFGVMSILMLILGFLTPPVGIVTLVGASVSKVPSSKVFMAQWPFWITIILACILIAAVPDIALILPNTLR